MLRRSIRLVSRALVAALVVTGCSVSVVPIRPHGGTAANEDPKTTQVPVVSLDDVSPDVPVQNCPDEPPPPVLDKSATFVLQNGHEKAILRMVSSADGRILASAGLDGTVRVWDVRAGILLRKFGTAGAFVFGISLSSDGKRLAYYAPSGSPESLAIQIVDLDRGTPPRSVTPQYGSFQLTSNGKQIAIATNKLTIFDVDSSALLHDVPLNIGNKIVLAVDFDEADKRVALVAPGDAFIVDVASGAILHQLKLRNTSAADTPMGVALLADHIVVRSAMGVVTLYPLNGSAPRVLPGNFREMAATAKRLWVTDFSKFAVSSFELPRLTQIELPKVNAPTAEVITTSTDGSTVMFAKSIPGTGTVIDTRDVDSMRPLRTIEGRETGIDAIAINAAANALVTGSYLGEVMRWNLGDGSLAVPLPQRERDLGRTVGAAFAPNGETFASATDGAVVRIRDAQSGRTLRSWQPNNGYHVRHAGFDLKTNDLITVVMRQSFKPTGKKTPIGTPEILTLYDTIIDRWSVAGPKPPTPPTPYGENARPDGKRIAQVDVDAKTVALSPKNDALALAGKETLSLVRLDTGATRWTTKFPHLVAGTTKNPDGTLDDANRWITFSPDGSKLLLSTSRLETNAQKLQTFVPVLFVIDAASGRITSTFHLSTHGPVAWRKNTVFIGGIHPALFDAPSMKVRASIAPPDNTITAVTLHPTRDVFVIGGDGGATSFVDEKGSISATLVSTPNGEWIATVPDGTYRSSIDGARSVAWSFSAPLEGFSFERFAARFDKPELIAQRLQGDAPSSSVELARPPRLQLDSFHEGVVRTEKRSLTVTTTASSASRVDRVRAFVDGRPVADKLVCAKEGQTSFNIPLHAGQNRMSLVAYDAAGQSSNTQSLDVLSTSSLAERPDLYVVAIGVSRYPNMTADQQLEYADDDAHSVAESLARHVGPDKPFANIHTTTLIDEAVTVESVEKAITTLRAMRPDDLGVVFFAGHGAKLAEGKMVFMTNQAAFTSSSAAKHGIGWDKIHAGLSSVRGRVLMMLDACHSGYLTTEIVAPNEELARQLAAGDRAGVLVFSAARGSQFSFEVPPQGASGASRGLELAWDTPKPPAITRELPGGHGLFTSALLEALSGGAPDRDRSGATEVGELIDYVTERVRASSNGKQTPWVARREMFGEFVVVPAKK